MKKPYNITWIENLEIQNVCQDWLEKNLLSAEQFQLIKTNFPEAFYRPGIFVKIGLFLFTLLAGSFFSGFISLFFVEATGYESLSTLSALSAVCYFIALEYFIKERKLFHSGIDNALLYMATGATMIPIFINFDHLQTWQYCAITMIVSGLLVFRYADALLALVFICALFATFATIAIELPQGKLFLPFLLMILSAIIYFLNQTNLGLYYKFCQTIIKVVSLVVFYLGGNYYVVREGNAILANLHTPFAPQIPFAGLFYFLTTTIPLLYIFFGLRRKDRILLITGLLAVAFSCFTFRNYFGWLPLEIALPVCGGVLIAVAAFVIRYLKTPKFGISDDKTDRPNLANLQAVIAAHQFGQAPQTDNLEFGGGNFGGGGAGESY